MVKELLRWQHTVVCVSVTSLLCPKTKWLLGLVHAVLQE